MQTILPVATVVTLPMAALWYLGVDLMTSRFTWLLAMRVTSMFHKTVLEVTRRKQKVPYGVATNRPRLDRWWQRMLSRA